MRKCSAERFFWTVEQAGIVNSLTRGVDCVEKGMDRNEKEINERIQCKMKRKVCHSKACRYQREDKNENE